MNGLTCIAVCDIAGRRCANPVERRRDEEFAARHGRPGAVNLAEGQGSATQNMAFSWPKSGIDKLNGVKASLLDEKTNHNI